MNEATLDRLADLAVGLRRERAARPDRVRPHRRRARAAGPRGRRTAPTEAGARHVEVSLRRPVVRSAPDRARHRRLDRLRAVVGRSTGSGRWASSASPRSAWRAPSTRRRPRGSTPTGSATTSRRPGRSIKLVTDRLINWTIVPTPTEAWAQVVHPDLSPEASAWRGCGRRSCSSAGSTTTTRRRPGTSAWRRLREVAGVLTERRFSAIAFSGPGTDLTVGLLPSSRWLAAGVLDGSTASSTTPTCPPRRCSPRPTRERVDGAVRSTKPLELEGTVDRGLRVRFEGGKAVEIDADRGADMLRTAPTLDEGASRPGRAGAGRRRGPDRPARHRLLHDADRRERRQPHRARATPTPSASRTTPTASA